MGFRQVDNTTFQKEVVLATSNVLGKSIDKQFLKVRVNRGNSVKVKGSEFIGHTVVVEDIPEVNVACVNVTAIRAETCHVMCASRGPPRIAVSCAKGMIVMLVVES